MGKNTTPVMPEFFALLKRRSGLSGAVMMFCIFRVAPAGLLLAFLALLLRQEWLNAAICLFLGFALLGNGLLMQVYLRNLFAREERLAKENTVAANEAAGAGRVLATDKPLFCAMPKCGSEVSDIMRPLCLTHYNDWVKEHNPNGPFVCAMPGCLEDTASNKRPLCTKHWQEWSGQPAAEGGADGDFRKKYPAKYRADDGHYVRSRGELLIDNYLFNAFVVHSYERKLPVEENLCPDFYIPIPGGGNVCIEYWGMENDPKYNRDKEKKLAVYEKYKAEHPLIQLRDEHLQNLDDHLPQELRKYGVKVK